MKTQDYKTRLLLSLSILSFILVLFCFLRAGSILRTVPSRTASTDSLSANEEGERFTSGWTVVQSDGSFTEIRLPYEEPNIEYQSITITHALSEADRSATFILDNLRQGLEVSINGELLYSVNTTALNQQIRFTDYQMITVPKNTVPESISITIYALEGSRVSIPEIYKGPQGSLKYTILQSEQLTIILLSVLGSVELLLLCVGIYWLVRKQLDLRLIDLFVFVSLVIVWGFSDSYLPVITSLPQEIAGLLCYVSLLALPLPISHFIWVSLGRKSDSIFSLTLLGAFNLILQLLGSLLGLFQLQQTFFISHIVLALTVLFSIRGFFLQRKTSRNALEMQLLFGGSLLLGCATFAALALYWFNGGQAYRNTLLAGVILFITLLAISLFYSIYKENHLQELHLSEMKIHQELSLHDGLTGMLNRRAFEQSLTVIERSNPEEADRIMIMMDVNGLKAVNDHFGHNAGDDLIVAAARVISGVYGNHGQCYRIGGDEFVVLLKENESEALPLLEDQLHQAIETSNRSTSWKLSIACGTSLRKKADGTILSISDWKQEADIGMYRNKASMTGRVARDLSQELREIIDCIVTTVEAKDLYTASHSARVRELSICIGQMLGISEMTQNRLDVAAYLHDIGKIAIPDAILTKPGKLTDEEYRVIKTHAKIGADIIGRAKSFEDISKIVLHHHERFDGRGYPSGISGENIPLESRIIAIADSIDAMTSNRCYRDALSLDECRSQIEKFSGIMYDPAITSIVLEQWSEIVDIVMLHPKHLI